MKKLWPVLSAVGCFALPGCGGAPATQDPPPVAPVAKPVAPAAAPTPIPVAAPPEMPSAPKPVVVKKSEVASEASSSAQSSSSQSPTQMVESFISQINSTEDKDDLKKLELDAKMLKYEYENANDGLMAASMNKLAVACEFKRLRQPYVDMQIRAARHDAELAEKMMREANQPQPTAAEWKQRFDAERARTGGRY
jgi:hypothetical protein